VSLLLSPQFSVAAIARGRVYHAGNCPYQELIMPKKTEGQNLEQTMQQLEELVVRMESGELSLDESLNAFKQGILLSKQCQEALQNAEQKVRILLEKTTNADLSDFREPSNQGGPKKMDSTSDPDFDDHIPF
jgi:exodeoxyribonuclease VII small subunit